MTFSGLVCWLVRSTVDAWLAPWRGMVTALVAPDEVS